MNDIADIFEYGYSKGYEDRAKERNYDPHSHDIPLLNEADNHNWISVDDELPNHNDFCKVITIYDDLLDCQFFNYIDDGERIIGFSWVNELDIDKNGKFTYSDVENSFGINDVKYFIVLPQPPKE